MKKNERIQVVLVFLFAVAALSFIVPGRSSSAQQQVPAEKPKQPVNPQAQEEPKNLQVLKGMTRPQVITVMDSWAEGLGVACNYCHVRPFEADTPRKAVARLMEREYVMGMKHRDGKVLSCKDCHQGQPNLLRNRPFDGVVGKKLPERRVLVGLDEDKLDRVMAGFAKALDVKCAYCHAPEFHTDTQRKQVARFMMTNFTRNLVKQDGSAVSCAYCHQGHARLLSSVPFARREQPKESGGNEPEQKKPARLQ